MALLVVPMLKNSLSSAKAVGDEPYTLTFQDDFNGVVDNGWTLIKGPSYVDGTWDFKNDIDHIGFKRSGETNGYGKFFYGTADSTNYAMEVKFRAEVNETLGEYMSTYSGNPASGMTINVNIPFFVTDMKSDNDVTFTGRAVSFNNYAIGFYEFGASSGWTKSVRLNTLFPNSFDWREYHTILVTAREDSCALYLDNVLMMNVANSAFTKCATNKGYCGFVGNVSSTYVGISFDDFRFFSNGSTDGKKTVTDISINDFINSSKVDYRGTDFAGNVAVTGNKLTYSATSGSDYRVLKNNDFYDASVKAFLDIDSQDVSKAGDVRTSVDSGIMLRADGSKMSDADGKKLTGYALSYYGVYRKGGTITNTVRFDIMKYTGISAKTTITGASWTLTDRTSCYVDFSVTGTTLSLKCYATLEDLNANTNALLNQSVTDTTYKHGGIGLKSNVGTTQAFTWSAELIHAEGTVASVPAPLEEEANKTITVTASEHGSVLANSVKVNSPIVVPTHSNKTLVVQPAEGYVARTTINGVPYEGNTIALRNITCDYDIDVTFIQPAEEFIGLWSDLRAAGGVDGICELINSEEMTVLLELYDSLSEANKAIVDTTTDVEGYTIGQSIAYVKATRAAQLGDPSLINRAFNIDNNKGLLTVIVVSSFTIICALGLTVILRKKKNK